MKNACNLSTSKCFAVVILASMLLCLPGCTRSGKVERALVSQITQSCRDQAPCQIRVDQATWFDWDKMYAFKYTATEPDREKALGMKDDGYRDLERQLVFLKNGKIVFQESEPTNAEHPIKNEVVFDIPDAEASKSFSRETVFSVTKLRSEAGRYFQLNQMK
jgi:hypothetical protein